MIKQTVFAISQDQTKPILMGELLEIVDGDISLVAIDGYRLAVRSCKIDNITNNARLPIHTPSVMTYCIISCLAL